MEEATVIGEVCTFFAVIPNITQLQFWHMIAEDYLNQLRRQVNDQEASYNDATDNHCLIDQPGRQSDYDVPPISGHIQTPSTGKTVNEHLHIATGK